VPRDLETVCLKCLEKSPDRRYGSAAELADDLGRFLVGEPVQAVPAGPLSRATKWARRRPAIAGLLAAVLFTTIAGVGGITWAYGQAAKALAEALAEKRDRLRKQAGQLRTAAAPAVPELLKALEPERAEVVPYLRELYEAGDNGRLRYAMALLPDQPELRDELAVAMLTANDPPETLLLRDTLKPFSADLKDQLWSRAEDKAAKPEAVFRALVALAAFDPDSSRWRDAGARATVQLLQQPSVFLGDWSKALQPVAAHLVGPLGDVYRGRGEADKRKAATDVLANYVADQPQFLADLLMDADEKQFDVIYPKLKNQGDRALPVLTGEIDKTLPSDLPSADERREKLAKRQATAAVALLRMNQPTKVWPLLKHSPDPRVRSYLIDRLSPLGADAKAIFKQLEVETDMTIHRALLLSLGEFSDQEFSPQDRKLMLPKLRETYRTTTDPGLHAAAEWLLKKWKEDGWAKQLNDEWAKDKAQREERLKSIQQLVTTHKEKAPPQWYVNSQGQTMVVIPGPVEFVMGSPAGEAGRANSENQHRKRINRAFVLADKAVTVEQYRKFKPRYGVGEIESWVRTADSPVIGTNWYQAVAYCNWLSQKEGLPESEWCYEPLADPNALPVLASTTVGLLLGSPFGCRTLSAAGGAYPGRTDPEYTVGMKLASNYLKRTGYRLPTEAEMEYATRAGAFTSRYYGETDELLSKYAWYQKNSQERTWPVGSLKPNDLGLFDVQGNVFTWCQESFNEYPAGKGDAVTEDKEDVVVVKSTDSRVLRGGSFNDRASSVRSALRYGDVPTDRHSLAGFRLARTLRLDSFTALPVTPEGGRK
jgi:formylglycine-generating enzyme required for sulfatase activity